MSATATIIGQVVTAEGVVQHADLTGEVVSHAVCPADSYVVHQRADIGVHFDHDESWRLGTCSYLERSRRWGLLAVAQVDADVADMLQAHRWYFSDRIVSERLGADSPYRGRAQIRELSLVAHTANCGTEPIVCVRGDIALGAAAPRTIPLDWDATWQRAGDWLAGAKYRSAKHTLIHDLDEPDDLARSLQDPTRLRHAATLKRANALPPTSPASNGVRVCGRDLNASDSARVIAQLEGGATLEAVAAQYA